MTDNVSDALRATCMKARIYTSAFGKTVTVKDVSREVERSKGAVIGAVKVTADKLAGADKHDKAVRAAQRFCVDALKDVSMPLANEDGWRLLPTSNFMPPAPLLKHLNEGKRMFDAALADYERDVDNILDRARLNLGELRVELPTKDELLSAYTLRTAFEELPSGVIPGLPEAANAKLQRIVQRKLEEAALVAREHTLERFVAPLKHFVSAMDKYDQYEKDQANWKEGDPKPTGIFRDSVVGNIKGLYETLASFNVLGDADITELGNMVASLASTEPDALRNHPAVRSAATQRAQAILGNLDSWLTPLSQAAE